MAKFLTGVMAGIAIGLLVAPDKGSNTRRKITQSFNDLLGEAKDEMNNMSNQFEGSGDGYNQDTDRPVAKISTDF